MTLSQRIVSRIFDLITRLLCRIDDRQLARVPDRGPLIIVTNHINILEIPIIYIRLQPRPFSALAAAYRWEALWSRWLLNLWGAIPVRRGEADMQAMRRALAWLEAGNILIVAPEGTRSRDGRLQKGHPGAVLLALHSGAPLLPLVFYGHEHYQENLRRLRRTDFHIAVGAPFYLETKGINVTRHIRQQMMDEVMYQLAALLPAANRGVYSDPNAAERTYLAVGSLHP
jgi:1-acyl-sn-glycerol-3-phosphate acyltransferase